MQEVVTLAWINPSWELDSSGKWWAASVQILSRGKPSQFGIYCAYFPAVINTPFRMMQGLFFFFPLLALCWANIWPSPFLWTINTPGLLWLLALHSFRERYQSARTELTPAPAKAIFTLPLLAAHHDLSSNISSPFPYNFFNFKKVFYLLISTDFCQHSTFSLDFSLSQFGRGLVKCMPSVSGLFTKFFYSSLQDLGWAL